MGHLNSLVNSLTALKIFYVLFILFIISSCFLFHLIFQDLLIVGCEEGTGSNFICYAYRAEVTQSSNCMLGNNRIAGLFSVLFISNACHNLLQQPKGNGFMITVTNIETLSDH